MQKHFRDVLSTAVSLLGELSDDECDFLALVVEAVCLQMDQKLRNDVNTTEFAASYIAACTMLSLSYYRSCADKSLSDFTAGTVSLSFRENSSALAPVAEQLLAPWLKTPVIFRGVRG